MSSSTSSSERYDRQIALKAACLTAGLVTAFGPSPAQAAVTSSGFQATNAGQATPIFDGYVLNASPTPAIDVPAPILSSPMASPSGNYGVAVFTPGSGSTVLTGQSFESQFLPNSPLTEGEVVNYIASGLTDTNPTDQNAYNTFLANLYQNYYAPSSSYTAGTPINAYGFSNGQPIGTIGSSQFNTGTPSYTGFGLVNAQAAVPEPGSLPLLLIGGAALAGMTITRRRRAR